MNCEHCNRILGSLSSLNYHKLHNKKCIEKQGVTNNIFSCSLCQKIFTSKDNLNKHICIKKNEIYLEYEEYNKKNNMEIEKQRIEIETQRIEIETQRIENEKQRIENETQRIENETQRIENEKQRNIVNLENEKQRNIVNLENEVNLQSKNKKLKTYKKELETCKKELETCKKELETYRNIVNLEKEVQRKEIDYLYTRIEKLDKTMSDALLQSVNKPTISNTNHNNFNLIPLDIGHRNNIKDIVENHYNLEYQINGQKGLAKLLADSGVLKPKGENIYICSDSSRGIFK
jgi:DNA repair exonuclease SbcCD ATPase subunit